MGTLRVLLALSVVYGHTGLFEVLGVTLVPGDTAVEVFYAISGFYMALVLNESYLPGKSTYLLFVGNRFARLFPVYVVVVLATLTLSVVVAAHSQQLPFVAFWQSLPPRNWPVDLLISAPQISFIGLDLTQILSLQKDGSISVITNFQSETYPLGGALIIPQAWTLGVEFWFYLFAPLIVRRSVTTIAMLIFASVFLRLFLQFKLGLHDDPWSYRFFPSELALFLAGVLGYRVYRSKQSSLGLHVCFAVSCCCIALAVLVNRWHGISRVASVALLLLLLLAIPILFCSTRRNRIDRYIGELSYPIYVCHFFVIWAMDYFFAIRIGLLRGSLIISVTILLAALLYFAIDRPVDAWRHNRLRPNAKPPIPSINAATYSASTAATLDAEK